MQGLNYLSELRALATRASTLAGNGSVTSSTERQRKNEGSADSKRESNNSTHGRIAEGLDSALIACVSLGLVYFVLGVIASSSGYILPVMLMRGGAALSSFLLLAPLRQKVILPR